MAKKEEKKRIIAKVLQTKSVVWRLLLIQGCFNRQAPSVRAAFQCSLSQELISLIKVFLFFGLESLLTDYSCSFLFIYFHQVHKYIYFQVQSA